MDTLALLFGSPAKVRIMRLFLFNPHVVFDFDEVGERTQSFASDVRRELIGMQKMGLIKRRVVSRTETVQEKVHKKVRSRKINGYTLDEHFPYLQELASLLTNTVPLKSGVMMRKLHGIGKLKLVVVAGVFTQDPDSRVDLLIVGDNLRKGSLENAIKFIESEVGKELRYAAFDTADFLYRMSVYDKLIKDILDYPHHKVIDRFGLK